MWSVMWEVLPQLGTLNPNHLFSCKLSKLLLRDSRGSMIELIENNIKMRDSLACSECLTAQSDQATHS